LSRRPPPRRPGRPRTPLKIGLDLFWLVPGMGRGGGFARYLTGLVRALRVLGGDERYVLFTNALNATMFPDTDRMRQVRVPLPPRRAVWPFRLLWLHAALPIAARRHALDLIHFPMDVASFAGGTPYVVTTNDLIADVYYPSNHPRSIGSARAAYLFAAKRRSARRARRVICPSEATAADVIRHYGVAREAVSGIPDGVDADLFGAARRGAPAAPPYVLSVVSLSPHKNVSTPIEAFSRARGRQRLPPGPPLSRVAGGGAGAPVSATIERAIAAGVPIKYLGFVDELTLASAYAGAALFVFLSKIEGFGLPPLEAMASGVPVVASNVSSIPEVCGDAAILVSPDGAEAAADAIAHVLTTPATASRLVAAGPARAPPFSLAATARA